MTLNRIHNATNPFQGKYKRVLCVCSAGLLRSPTAALVLSQEPYNFNTRAVGSDTYHALVPLESVHVHWADEIVCMHKDQVTDVKFHLEAAGIKKPIINLNIPDKYSYRDPEMMALIKKGYDDASIMEAAHADW